MKAMCKKVHAKRNTDVSIQRERLIFSLARHTKLHVAYPFSLVSVCSKNWEKAELNAYKETTEVKINALLRNEDPNHCLIRSSYARSGRVHK